MVRRREFLHLRPTSKNPRRAKISKRSASKRRDSRAIGVRPPPEAGKSGAYYVTHPTPWRPFAQFLPNALRPARELVLTSSSFMTVSSSPRSASRSPPPPRKKSHLRTPKSSAALDVVDRRAAPDQCFPPQRLQRQNKNLEHRYYRSGEKSCCKNPPTSSPNS